MLATTNLIESMNAPRRPPPPPHCVSVPAAEHSDQLPLCSSDVAMWSGKAMVLVSGPLVAA